MSITRMEIPLLGALALAASLAGPAQAQPTHIGEHHQCIRLQAIDQTPVIDDHTILVKMKAGGGYRRIDLMNTCSGLKIQGGFSFATSTQDICTSTGLRVIDGGPCMIKDIVTIDKAEAKELKSRR